jgi:tetratricopeptide (TPR) repeat protein
MAAGIALSGLDRDEEAIENSRLAAGSFATAELWRPYVGAVSSLGTSLTLLGRLAEARREFARALKLTSQGDRPASHAAIRHNLGTVLFRGASYAKAARSFQAAAELYDRLELLSDAAINRLHLAECLARIGRADAALDCILGIESRLAGTPDLDPAVLRELSRQLSGDRPDFDLVRDLRERLESAIRSGERHSG